MTTYHPHSRRAFRRGFWSWTRDRTRLAVGLAAGTVALLALLTVIELLLFPLTPWVVYLLGIVHAAVIGVFLHLWHLSYLALDPGALNQVRGAWGEDNTRDELRAAKRRRLIWGSVDSISLAYGDIDHLVVPRRGGLVAVDSKWRNEVDPQRVVEMAQAAGRARTRADGVVRSLLQKERATHRARGTAYDVTPLVVIRGAQQERLPVGGAVVEGVQFVRGRELRAWLRQREGPPVDRGAAMELIRRLEVFRRGAVQPRR